MESGQYMNAKMEIVDDSVENIQVDALQVEGSLQVDEANSIQIDPNTTTIIFEPVENTSIIVQDTIQRYEPPKPVSRASEGRKTRRYSEELFLKFGFIPSPTNIDLPLCLLCERVFSNESMKTPRLREHLTKIHPDKLAYDVSYFKALREQFYITRKLPEESRYSESGMARKRPRPYARRDKELMDFSFLLPKSKLDDLARIWLEEDCPTFDYQGLFVGRTYVRAEIKCKENALLAGFPFVEAVLRRLNSKMPTWNYEEGTYLHEPADEGARIIGTIVAPADEILVAERIILNLLARCSGVATAVHNARTSLSWNGWTGQLVGSRKTTPGFRLVEKYGLLCGGGGTHRMDMSQMVMLKDNHIKAAGSGKLSELIQKTKQTAGFHMKVEVECRNTEQALQAGQAGADIVMLDNFTPEDVAQGAKEIKAQFPAVLVEASGGINLENCVKYAVPCVDIISMSCLVQGYKTIDFSIDFDG